MTGFLRLATRAAADRAVEFAVEFGELAPQQFEMPGDGPHNPALGRPATAVALGDHHLDDPGLRRGRLWRRRATSSPKACAAGSAIGRAGGRMASAK